MHGSEHPPHLLELHDVWVYQGAVIDDLALHVLGNLRMQRRVYSRSQTCESAGSDPPPTCDVGSHLVTTLNELDGKQLACRLILAQLHEAKRAAVQVLHLRQSHPKPEKTCEPRLNVRDSRDSMYVCTCVMREPRE